MMHCANMGALKEPRPNHHRAGRHAGHGGGGPLQAHRLQFGYDSPGCNNATREQQRRRRAYLRIWYAVGMNGVMMDAAGVIVRGKSVRRFVVRGIVFAVTYVVGLLSGCTATAQTTVPAWRPHTPLPLALAGHASVLLPTGDVLVAGGIDAGHNASRASFLYSSTTGAYRPTLNQLVAARGYHTLVPVQRGAGTVVFAIGGYSGTAGSYAGQALVEMLEYDAAASNWRWRAIGTLRAGRGDLRACFDGANSVIVTGGREQTNGALHSGTLSAASERIDVATLGITAMTPMSAARAEHAMARFTGDNGTPRVLAAGGEAVAQGSSTQIVLGNAWDVVANPPVSYHTAGVGVGDPAGIARVFGGYDTAATPTAACEWYDTKQGWRAAPRMQAARARFSAGLIAGTRDTATAYLAIGGIGRAGDLASTEVFRLPNPASPNGAWLAFAPLVTPGSERLLAISGANIAIATGGRTLGGTALAETEAFQPLRASDVDFGDQEVGGLSDSVVVTIENTWLLPVRVRDFRIAGSAEFSWRGDTANFTLAAGGQRTVRLYFQPAAPGPRTGMLLFNVGPLTDTVLLRGRGVASQLSVLVSPLDFGARLVGTSTLLCEQVLRNNGTDTATIDSITITPAGAFRLLRPIGKSMLAPGDSLRICAEFQPTAQGPAQATATLHVGSRAFGLQMIGRGLRRYAIATVLQGDCDTVEYTAGVETSGFVAITNPGDTVVHLDLPLLHASANGLFRLANPTAFPMDLAPGAVVTVEVIHTPKREARELLTMDFPNNGDTITNTTLCFVTRARYLAVSQGTVALGAICHGDTATALLTVENPGGFDTVTIDGAEITPASELELAGFAPARLGPHDYRTLRIRYAPTAAGTLAGLLILRTSRGNVSVPITATALPAVLFEPRGIGLTVGDTTVVPIDLRIPPAGGIQTTTLLLEYDPTLLRPLGIAPVPGGAELDTARSSLRLLGGGRAMIELRWRQALTAPGIAFGLIAEALRGNAPLAALALNGAGDGGFCVTRAATLLAVAPPCPGGGGLVNAAGAELIAVAPNPATGTLAITLATTTADPLRVELISTTGAVARTMTFNDGYHRTRTFTIAAADIPAGAYVVRALAGGRVIARQTVVIAH